MSDDLKPLNVKAPLHLLPARPLRAISAAIEHGALKYAPWNWQDKSRNDERVNEQMAALLRHVTAAADPVENDHDEESGLHHLAHAGACLMILLHKLGIDYKPSRLKLKKWETQMDDRTKLPPGAAELRRALLASVEHHHHDIPTEEKDS